MRVRHRLPWITLSLLAACARCDLGLPAHVDRFYPWNERRVLCSLAIDDLGGTQVDWSRIQGMFASARDLRWVVVLHAHAPGITISLAALERVLAWADAYHLDYVTFDDLDPDRQQRAGLALAFDDDSIEEWYGIRDLLFLHRARVTFFVTGWTDLTGPQLAKLAQLRRDGHALEPHGLRHANAVEYARDHGIDAYVADEVLPSIQAMQDAGYHPTSFAYPHGAHDAALDAAVLQHVDRVRTTLAGCPP